MTMISPRSFIYSRHPSPSSTSSPRQQLPPNDHHRQSSITRPIDIKSPVTIPQRKGTPKYDSRQSHPTTVTVTPIPRQPDSIAMGKRKDRRESPGLAPPSPPSSPTTKLTRPTTPSSPVQIPNKSNRETAHHPQKRHNGQRRKEQSVHTPGDISPSVAALLAMTSIPRQRGPVVVKGRKKSGKALTVSDILKESHVSEKELSWSLTRSLSRDTMDMLLSPPREALDDDVSISDCNIGSALSTRTISVDSIPSLVESYATEALSSFEGPLSRSSSFRGRRMSPMRRSLEPCLSPPGEDEDHPLAKEPLLEESVDDDTSSQQSTDSETASKFESFKPFRTVFKSNLTASLRALRSAAKSISTINFTSIPSDDFLTRSLLSMDAKVPYTDERRPPAMEDVPSAETRRYLNPLTTSRIETQLATLPPPGTFSASIQMQTYKVHRSRQSSRKSYPRASLQETASAKEPQKTEVKTTSSTLPGMRQREVRENPDFIRIAVMEMAMRKRGKLDDKLPGRARWTLPPRKNPTATYEIGADGVPARWISVSNAD